MMIVSAERLSNYLGAARWELLLRVTERAARLGYSTFLAGGIVRDLLLDRLHKDIDLLIEGDAIKLARLMAKEEGGTAAVHAPFGTAAWNVNLSGGAPEVVHLVTARSETYPAPAALPVVQHADVKQDLGRRDFSINAMAISLDEGSRGELLDPSKGEDDLRRGVIRALHGSSYVDDPTRMYRAVRYEQRLAFKQDEATFAQIAKGRPHVARLSGERIRNELDLILAEPDPAGMLARLDELGLLLAIHPALAWDPGAGSRIEKALAREDRDRVPRPGAALVWILWLMGLAPASAESVSARLGLHGELSKALRVATQLREQLPSFTGMKPSAIAASLRRRPDLAIEAMAIYAGGAGNPFKRYLDEWRTVAPKTTGARLASLGIRPGPIYGEIIEELRSAWIDGEVDSEGAESDLLSRILARPDSSRRIYPA